MDIAGKNAVVVGGATGIGSGICRALVNRGARVHLCDIDLDGARELAAELGDGVAGTYRCDVTDPASVAAARDAIAAHGEIALVFANAGAISLKPLVETTPQDWEWLFGINVFGTVNTVRAFLPTLLAQPSRSRIVVTSSVAALRTPPMQGQTMYMASKAAQLGMVNGLRTEVAGTNVDLSVIFPGPVASKLRVKSEARRPGAVALEVPPAVGSSGYLQPAEAGERIVRQVEQDKPYIGTHQSERDLVREAQDQMLEAFTFE